MLKPIAALLACASLAASLSFSFPAVAGKAHSGRDQATTPDPAVPAADPAAPAADAADTSNPALVKKHKKKKKHPAM